MKPSFLHLGCAGALSTVFVLCSVASAANIIWSGADAINSSITNWSDGLNWIGGVEPGASATANLTNNAGMATASGAAYVDNIVDANVTVAGLAYTETALTTVFHNTVINPGVTLTIKTNTIAIALLAGSQDDQGGTCTPYNTISGPGGTLVINNTNVASTLLVSQTSFTADSSHMATLDLSGLDNFNATFGRLLIAVQGQLANVTNQPVIPDIYYPQGTLILAKTNMINMTQLGGNAGPVDGGNGAGQGGAGSLSGPAILIGDASTVTDPALPCAFMLLGQTNSIYSDSIVVGRMKSAGTLEFNSGLSAPAVYIRGVSSNRVAIFRVADNSSLATSASEPCSGTVDFSAGTADVMINVLIIGNGQIGNGTSADTGAFTMGAGTLNANTVELGYQNSAAAAEPTTGTLTVNSGNLVVNNQIILGNWLGGSMLPKATLNVSGGTVTVANGILDQSGNAVSSITVANGSAVTTPTIGSPAAPIGSLTIGDSTLNLAVASSFTAPVAAVNLATDSSTSNNLINVTSISPSAGLASIITLIQSSTPIQNLTGNNGGNLDFKLGTLPAGYGGYLQTNTYGTEVQLVLTSSPNVANNWTGADFAAHNNTNWSDGLNWSTGVAPGPSNPAFFYNAGSVGVSALSTPGGGPGAIIPSRINNVVDTNFTILELAYANTNGTYHNTFISNNATLNVTLNGLFVGSPNIDLGNTEGNVTISGGAGTFNVTNSSSVIYVGLGDSSMTPTAQTTLDMSGLGAFNANVANLLVGIGGYNSGLATVLQPVGIVYLAQTNNIIASSSVSGANDFTPVALEVGEAGDAETLAGYQNSTGSSLYLGQTNAIFADYITVGRQWGTGGIYFNPAFANSTAYFRGVSANAVAVWNIGDGVQNTLTVAGGAGTNDFTGGTINALVNTMNIAKSSPNSFANTAVAGTLTFNAGIVNANTINVSDNPTNLTGSYYNYGVGTINVNGTGTLIVNNTLNLGFTPGVQSAGAPIAALNINGSGAVLANNIVPGGNGTVSTISMNGGALTISNVVGVGSSSIPLTSLSLTNNPTITVGLLTSSAFTVANLNADGLNSTTNTINISSLPAIEQYPLTFTIIQSLNPINLAGGVFNFKLGSLPAASPSYVATITESADHTAVLLTLTGGPSGPRGNVTWVGPDPNTSSINWSDPINWLLPPVPSPQDTPLFNNIGSSLGPGADFIDNIVDTNLTVAGVIFTETNAYHNTVINPGKTLTISNNTVSIPLLAGTQTDPGSTTLNYNTVSGTNGTLVINNTNIGSAVVIQQCSGSSGTESHMATVDLSGLDTFKATVGRLLIGVQGFTNTTGQVPIPNITRAAGTLILARTNVITLTQLGNIQGPVDTANGNGTGSASIAGPALVMDDNFGTPETNTLWLGQTNTIFADTITVGRQKSLSCTMIFNPSFIAPALYLRGVSENRVSAFYVADDSHVSTSSTACSGTADLSAGTSDVMIDTLGVAKGESGNGSATVTGTLIMGPGVLNVNTVYVGQLSATNAGGNVIGTVNVNSGNLVVNNQIVLGQWLGGTALRTRPTGTLNVFGGTVSAKAILSGGGINTSINLTNGTLSLTSVSGSIGTAAAPINSISISNSTLNLAIGSFPPVVTSNLVASSSANNTINVTALPPIGSVPATNTLIQSANPIAGAFEFVLGSLPSGYTGTLGTNVSGTAIQLVINTAPYPPHGANFTSVTLSAGNVVLAGTNGLANGVYYVLSSTNVALPFASWTTAATSTYDGGGNFNIAIPATNSPSFYIIKSQ